MATIQELTQQADMGNTSAMCELASNYGSGKNGVSYSKDMAIYWYEKAARKEKARSVDLAKFLMRSGDTEDRERAFDILHQMANEGWVCAYADLGYCYMASIGTKNDDAKALYWLAKASVNGSSNGYYLIGRCFEQGRGIARDLKYAMACYHSAAQKGNGNALSSLALFYHDGLCCPPDFTKAYSCARQAADMNVPDGYTVLGMCYYHGHGVEKNENEAYRLFCKAERTYRTSPGLTDYYLGLCYYHGHGTKYNSEMAHSHFTHAANWYTPAKYMLAQSHHNRAPEKRNYPAGVKCYKEAADAGHIPAMARIGAIYLYGQYGQSKDHAAAVRYLLTAADRGDKSAQKDLAACYSNGWGVSKDMEKMRYWSECSNGLRYHAKQLAAFDPASVDPIARILPQNERKEDLNKHFANTAPKASPKTVTTTTYSTPQESPNRAGTKIEDGKKLAELLLPHIDKLEINIPQNTPAAPKAVSAPPQTAPTKPKTVTAEDRKQATALALKAMEAYRKSQFEEAFRLGRQAVNMDVNCSKANLLLGWLYHHGLHVPQDKNKALSYFQISMETLAYNCIGCYHYNGWGGKPVNKKEALQFFLMGASQNNLSAMCNAAQCFSNCISLDPKDSQRKTEKYRRKYLEDAAEKGSMRACSILMMEHLMDRSPRMLNKYKDLYTLATKKTTYLGVIKEEQDALKGTGTVTMGLLFE